MRHAMGVVMHPINAGAWNNSTRDKTRRGIHPTPVRRTENCNRAFGPATDCLFKSFADGTIGCVLIKFREHRNTEKSSNLLPQITQMRADPGSVFNNKHTDRLCGHKKWSISSSRGGCQTKIARSGLTDRNSSSLFLKGLAGGHQRIFVPCDYPLPIRTKDLYRDWLLPGVCHDSCFFQLRNRVRPGRYDCISQGDQHLFRVIVNGNAGPWNGFINVRAKAQNRH